MTSPLDPAADWPVGSGPNASARKFAEWFFARENGLRGNRERVDLLTRITDERDRAWRRSRATRPPEPPPLGGPARSELMQILYDFLEDYKAASMTSKLDAVKRAIDAIVKAGAPRRTRRRA